MIESINNTMYATPQPVSQSRSDYARAGYSQSSTDIVTISQEAQNRLAIDHKNSQMVAKSHADQEPKEVDGTAWGLSSGMEQGTFILKNGNKQVVSIEDGVLEIEEFNNGKLVKTVNGTITDRGAVLDTAYYDDAGRISQSIYAEITEGEGEDGWSVATMSRSVQWFENGQLKGDMQDEMLLHSWDSSKTTSKQVESKRHSMLMQGMGKVDVDTDDLTKLYTLDKHTTNYFASINEYGDNGKLARNTVVEQGGRYDHVSNRHYAPLGGLGERSTEELKHNTQLSVEIKDYDSDGELIRDARLTDSQKDKRATSDGMQKQTVDVSWFSGGELIKQSHGSMEMGETHSKHLAKRPTLLESVGLTSEEYLGKEPKSAMDLLNVNLLESSAESEFFTAGISSHIGHGDYNSAEGVARYGSPDQPYSVSWTDEVYKEGELVGRQKDTESAKESTFYQHERGVLFRKGGGLTENADPVVLRQTAHENEVYHEGEMTAHQTMKARESVDVDFDGPDRLVTNAVIAQGLEGSADTTALQYVGPLTSIDSNANAAAKGLDTELEASLSTLYETISSANVEEVSESTSHRIRLNYQSKG